jgi:magnesium-transporting ATPase (P-type)
MFIKDHQDNLKQDLKMENHWHNKATENCLTELDTTQQGLPISEVEHRLKKYGKNEIQVGHKKRIWERIINQFNNSLIYILWVAAIITLLLRHWLDASVIVGVVFLNALIGYLQEGKAEKSIEALTKKLSLKAVVMRDAKRTKILASELVPGDIVFLYTGDKVPADLRLLKTNNLQIDEAMLTGESVPTEKNIELVPLQTLLTNRSCIAYSGTLVTYGTGIGVVVNTGTNSEIGQVSKMLAGLPKLTTPLLRQITKFGHWLAFIITLFSVAIFLFGIFLRSYPLDEMFLAAVAIAVSIIPEGLPAIITIALAIGVARMANRNAIIRRLPAVETLSSVTVICTDKTGTLTKNELTVQKVITSHQSFLVTGSGYNDQGKIIQNEKNIDAKQSHELSMLIKAGALCNEAELRKENEKWHRFGNPVDGALLVLGLKTGINYGDEIKNCPRTDFIPFDSKHKFVASLHHDHKGNSFIFVKGAPERILSFCSYQLRDNQQEVLDKNFWQSQINSLAQDGMRVLALAYRKTHKEHTSLLFKDVEHALVFLGIVGIIDPPREEVLEAVLQCQQAGIRVKMVTGDHGLTAVAIGKQVGINNPRVLSGENLDVMSDEELQKIVQDIDIYVRTIPEHKLRLIKALRERDHTVAMTGDGVNDAPALYYADIGIAMGIKGTDVAKEASEIVLADDNFSSIKYAIEEGRNVYNNVKKAILFVLPNDAAEGLSVFFAILFGYTVPITPLQILWVNMVTAVTLGLALAFESPEKKLMSNLPRDAKEPLLSKFLLWRISFVSFLFLCSVFGLFIYEIKQGVDVDIVRTMVVNLLVLAEIFYLINCRRIYDSVLSTEGLFGSYPVLISIAIVLLLQIGFTYLPVMQYLFKTKPIDLLQWGFIVIIATTIFLIVEFEKKIIRRFSSRSASSTQSFSIRKNS